jgi:acyl carrier protein
MTLTQALPTASAPTAQDLQGLIAAFVARETNVAADDIDIDAELSEYQFDSTLALGLVAELEDRLGRKLSPTLAYNYPTVRLLAGHLAGGR